MTEYEKERLGKYDQFTDEELLQLPKEKKAEFKYLAEQEAQSEQSSEDSLYSKALQVGYSGLSNDEQSKLDYHYANSEAANKMSLDEVHAKMDANAAMSKQMSDANVTLVSETLVSIKSKTNEIVQDITPQMVYTSISIVMVSPFLLIALVWYVKLVKWVFRKTFNWEK